MNLLAFESSAKAASVALLRDGKPAGEYFQNSGQTHSRTLLTMAEQLLRDCDMEVTALDAVAVAAGPGSFTGLRIGVAAAKGLAWGRQIPVIGVSTLEAMVHSTALCDGVYVCCMDARRQQVYNAVFSVENGSVCRRTEDRAISVEDLGKELENTENVKILVGDGAELCYNTLCKRNDLLLAPEHLRMQRAAGVALVAQKLFERGEYPAPQDVAPNYLRLSQAERERAEKNKREL